MKEELVKKIEEVNEIIDTVFSEKVEDLKINGITLIKISKGKNVKYITGSEEIEKYLK